MGHCDSIFRRARDRKAELIRLAGGDCSPRPTDEDLREDIYALCLVVTAEAFPEAPIRVESLSLSTDETREVRLPPSVVVTRLRRYDEAIAGIRRGDFRANPNSRDCLRCRRRYVCPAEGGA